LKKGNLAREVACLIESVSPLIEDHTRTVCPSCPDVCCINKHSYHDRSDFIYLQALGANMPSYKPGIADSDPCQFIGDYGCTLERSLRPYRCTWYFCTPLLEHIQKKSVRKYRRLMDLLKLITQKRTEMLDEFTLTAKKS